MILESERNVPETKVLGSISSKQSISNSISNWRGGAAKVIGGRG